ncbi:MAG: FAD-dependent oxidoreductase [Microbacterium sp.]|uniref:FAD-dependent oxidoreductase n=1 Tax=Microbacterium sp. TaxID=51671 RepID=UPI0039E698F8
MGQQLRAEVCVVGGGPAGIVLGLLLARAGIEVVVLEKHDDFLRDFRGDTVHPSTLNLIDALGLRERFDAVPHTPLPTLDAVVNGVRLRAVDFTTLPPPNRFVTLMPQWDLLDLLASEGARHPSFHLVMGAEATDVTRGEGRVRGVRARTAEGELVVEAKAVVAADGRASAMRPALGLEPWVYGVPADVLWFRLPEPQTPMPATLGWATADAIIVTIPRPGYLQCGMIIPKGAVDATHAAGLDAFRARVSATVPPLRESAAALVSWDDIKHLSVRIERLWRWWIPGALCIGDAAHAMSPVFGVGINYAVQDAVATANALIPAFHAGGAPEAIDRAFTAVQRRRALPTALMQAMQRGVHRVIATGRGLRLLHNPPTRGERALLRLVLPLARRVMSRLVGYGFRPERLRR